MSTLEKNLRFGYKIAVEHCGTHNNFYLLKNDKLIAQIQSPYALKGYDDINNCISDHDDYVVVIINFDKSSFLLTEKFWYKTYGIINKRSFRRGDGANINLFFVYGYRRDGKGLRVLSDGGEILYANDDLTGSGWSHEVDLLFIEKYIEKESKTLVKTLAIIDLRTLRVY